MLPPLYEPRQAPSKADDKVDFDDAVDAYAEIPSGAAELALRDDEATGLEEGNDEGMSEKDKSGRSTYRVRKRNNNQGAKAAAKKKRAYIVGDKEEHDQS
jgi:hypothetical protein